MRPKDKRGRWRPEWVRAVLLPAIQREGTCAAACRELDLSKKQAERALALIGHTARSATATSPELATEPEHAEAPAVEPLDRPAPRAAGSITSMLLDPWDEWCEEAIAEVSEVVRRNDAVVDGDADDAWRFIPARKMAERLRSRWSVKSATAEHVKAYARGEMGRQSWRDP